MGFKLLKLTSICQIRPMSRIEPPKQIELSLRLDEAENSDPDYLAWRDQKVRRALVQSSDRRKMIPTDDVWKDLGH